MTLCHGALVILRSGVVFSHSSRMHCYPLQIPEGVSGTVEVSCKFNNTSATKVKVVEDKGSSKVGHDCCPAHLRFAGNPCLADVNQVLGYGLGACIICVSKIAVLNLFWKQPGLFLKAEGGAEGRRP